MSLSPGIEELASTLQESRERIARLAAQNSEFRSLCFEYAEAARALRHWSTAGISARERAEEYRRVLRELELEARRYLRVTVIP